MDKKEIAEFLSTDEGRAILAEHAEGLRLNRDQILAEKKALAADRDALANQLDRTRREVFHLKSAAAIRAAIADYDLDPEVRPIIERHFAGLEGLNISDGGDVIVTDQTGADVPINLAAREFFTTGAGRKFVRVRSSGGGATGSQTSPPTDADALRAAASKLL